MSERKYFWAGFISGQIDIEKHTHDFEDESYRPALFTCRKTAQRKYEDVRKVKIKEAEK